MGVAVSGVIDIGGGRWLWMVDIVWVDVTGGGGSSCVPVSGGRY